MPDLSQMFESKYLKGDDFPEPEVVTIQGFKKVNMAKEGQEVHYKWLCKFKEFERPMVANKTNLKRMAKIFDSENTDNWIGKRVELFYDENVEMAGEIVGGLRVRKAPPPPAERKPTGDGSAGAAGIDDDIPW